MPDSATGSATPEAPAGTAPVEVRALTFRYAQRTALDALSLRVHRGEVLGLLGPNGSGKSTLMRVLATLQHPHEGSARIEGFDVVTQAALVRQRLGVAFQSPSLDGKLTVRENLRFQGYLFGLRGATLAERIDGLLEAFGIREREGDYVETLSGGLKRRVELAKALLHRPPVLLLDEPSTGLDPAARLDFWKILLDLRASTDLTLVVTTHLMDEAERCDRVALLDQGKLVALDTPEALKAQLGGDVLTVEARDPAALAQRIGDRLGLTPQVDDGALRLESPDGLALAGRLLEGFKEEITALRLGKPTLEDVFLARTGRRLREAEDVA